MRIRWEPRTDLWDAVNVNIGYVDRMVGNVEVPVMTSIPGFPCMSSYPDA
jgi:hypothetical protein